MKEADKTLRYYAIRSHVHVSGSAASRSATDRGYTFGALRSRGLTDETILQKISGMVESFGAEIVQVAQNRTIRIPSRKSGGNHVSPEELLAEILFLVFEEFRDFAVDQGGSDSVAPGSGS